MSSGRTQVVTIDGVPDGYRKNPAYLVTTLQTKLGDAATPALHTVAGRSVLLHFYDGRAAIRWADQLRRLNFAFPDGTRAIVSGPVAMHAPAGSAVAPLALAPPPPPPAVAATKAGAAAAVANHSKASPAPKPRSFPTAAAQPAHTTAPAAKPASKAPIHAASAPAPALSSTSNRGCGY